MSQTVLVLGGGVGDLVAAPLPRQRLPRGHRVVVVKRHPPGRTWHTGQVLFEPGWFWRWS